MKNQLKLLVLDIETRPIEAYVWETRDQNIALNQIKTDWCVIAWAAKWLGDKGVIYRDQRNVKDIGNDKPILQTIWKLLDEADIVITQNGKNFDCPKLNARFLQHGMPPPSPYRHLDTYQIARSAAKFTSNKLEYLTDKLNSQYKKLSHAKFPGFSLWVECLKGNKAAWDEMRKYNIHDVLATEELYMKIRAWAPANTPTPWFIQKSITQCHTCGATKLVSNGQRVTNTARYMRLRCLGCGSHEIGPKIKEPK